MNLGSFNRLLSIKTESGYPAINIHPNKSTLSVNEKEAHCLLCESRRPTDTFEGHALYVAFDSDNAAVCHPNDRYTLSAIVGLNVTAKPLCSVCAGSKLTLLKDYVTMLDNIVPIENNSVHT